MAGERRGVTPTLELQSQQRQQDKTADASTLLRAGPGVGEGGVCDGEHRPCQIHRDRIYGSTVCGWNQRLSRL